MKRVLRNTDTQMFIKNDGGQTQSLDTARSFTSYDDAVAFCRKNQLAKIELLVHEDDKSEYAIPLRPRDLASR